MDAEILSKVCAQVYSKYPEVNGIRPKVHAQAKVGGTNHLLIFAGNAKSSSGKVLPRVLRVVVSDDGKIIKVTTSK
jgi:hypothetical protein